jgi:outer membrane protein insertion porin family
MKLLVHDRIAEGFNAMVNRVFISRILFRYLIILGSWMTLIFPGALRAQDGFAVQVINFTGNESISSGTLKQLMETKSIGAFARLLGKKGPEYSEAVMVRDIDRIRAFYQREGFLDVIVAPAQAESDQRRRTVRLTVQITEGEPIRVREITHSLTSLGSIPDSVLSALLKRTGRELSLRPEARFRDSAVFFDQMILAREFGNIGYPYVKITPELTVSRPDHAVDIEWRIESGPKCYFGDVRVGGATNVPTSVIARQVAFQSGDLYRLRLIERTQRQVYGLGTFQIATTTPAFSRDSGEVIPVDVFVKDAKRLTTKLGLGYGTEDRFRVFSDTRLLGFLGGARRLQLYIKHSHLDPYYIIATLTQPAFPTPGTTLITSPFVWRQNEPGYTVNRFGATIGAVHQFSTKLSGSVSYSVERVKVAQSILAETSDSTEFADLYNKSQLILGSFFDNSGPLFNPRRGFYNSNTIAFSGFGFGGKTRYLKLQVDLRRYQSLAMLVLATRIKLGGIRTYTDKSFVPVEERFYSGGSSSVRGWARSELGPHEAGLPIGGQSLLEASAELRFPIWDLLSGVVFTDAGNVWTKSFSYHMDDLRFAAGGGPRFATPIGPIRLDVAWPVDDDDKKMQFHISIGQAF